jgi:hypothetical protein
MAQSFNPFAPDFIPPADLFAPDFGLIGEIGVEDAARWCLQSNDPNDPWWVKYLTLTDAICLHREPGYLDSQLEILSGIQRPLEFHRSQITDRIRVSESLVRTNELAAWYSTVAQDLIDALHNAQVKSYFAAFAQR